MVEAVAFEFSQTEDFPTTAEKLAGPYRWGRYDLLCLPPSFPYGGMENPCLTFVTPTLLAGDKSLADVVSQLQVWVEVLLLLLLLLLMLILYMCLSTRESRRVVKRRGVAACLFTILM
jgi:hypothetical protein